MMNRRLIFPFMRTWSYRLMFFTIVIFLGSCDGGEGETDDESKLIEDNATTSNVIENHSAEAEDDGMARIEIPSGYTILSEATGDLDGDGIKEKVVVYDTERPTQMGTERELRIYVDQNGIWSLWHTSIGPVLSSESGGLLGDPFERIEIIAGSLLISHYGGSSDRWSYLHEFKYVDQNWSLVGATLVYYKSCDYSETYTYDLTKNTGFHSYQRETCNENGETIQKEMDIEESLVINGKDKRPAMDNFQPGETPANIVGNQSEYFY